jgi:ACS family hexuronate transporter-like MFS transporter
MLSPLVAFAPIHLSILLASCIALAHMAWLVNLTAMLFELFPSEQLGKAAGFVAAGSALGGMISSEIIGYCVQHGGYRPVFFLMAIMHPLAIAIMWTSFRPGKTDHYNLATAEAQG